MSLKSFGIVVLALLVSGCGKVTTTMNHNIQSTNTFRKATPQCKEASATVLKELEGVDPFWTTNTVWLYNGVCAVQVLVRNHDSAAMTTMLDKMKVVTKYYSFIKVPRIPVNLWLDELPVKFNPIKDTAGKVLTTDPTDQECNVVRDRLAALLPTGLYTTVVDSTTKRGSKRCYVEAVFADDVNYKKMLTWPDLANAKQDPFHYYLVTGVEIKVTKTIWIHIVRQLPDDPNLIDDAALIDQN